MIKLGLLITQKSGRFPRKPFPALFLLSLPNTFRVGVKTLLYIALQPNNYNRQTITTLCVK